MTRFVLDTEAACYAAKFVFDFWPTFSWTNEVGMKIPEHAVQNG